MMSAWTGMGFAFGLWQGEITNMLICFALSAIWIGIFNQE
jgi:hypothetical protein